MAVYLTPFVTLTHEAAAYAAGDALGGRARFDNLPEHGTIMSVLIIDRADQGVAMDVVLFRDTFTATADNAPFDPADADLQNWVGTIVVVAGDWANWNTSQGATQDNIGLPYWAPAGTLYFQCVSRGAPTFAATDDVRVALGIVY